MFKFYVCFFALLTTTASKAANPCENAPADTKRIFCSSAKNQDLFGQMQTAFDGLAQVSPEYETAAMKIDHAGFLARQARSCATNGGPSQVEECAKRRMEEQTELFQFRKKNPVTLARPVPPEGSFVKYCEAAMAANSPARSVLTYLKRMMSATTCEDLDKTRLSTVSIDFLEMDKLEDAEKEKLLKQGIDSLEPLAYFPNLLEIRLPYGSQVSDLKPLGNLTLLKRLNMSASKIANLDVLRDLKGLEEINVRTSKVKDIAPIMDLLRIRSLDLRNLKVPKAQINEFKRKHPLANLYL
jgi:hypothetical protein